MFGRFCAETGFDPSLGFFHPSKAGKLDEAPELEAVFEKLAAFARHGGIRASVEGLSPASIPADEPSIRRLFLILTFVAQAYLVGGCGEDVIDELPAAIADPLANLSAVLQLPPVISYASTVQFNIPSHEVALVGADDFELIGTITGTSDEEWFYKSSMFIERCAPEIIEAAVSVHECLEAGSHPDSLTHLRRIKSTISTFKNMLARVREGCDPFVFYGTVRRYLMGSVNNPEFPGGVVYGGFRRSYHGASAGQSPLIMLVDVIVGVEHRSDFTQLMHEYVPSLERAVIQYFKNLPSLKSLVLLQDAEPDAYKAVYNEIVMELYLFREEHLRIVSRYIIKEASKINGPTTGTAGTNALSLLLQYKSETIEALIK